MFSGRTARLLVAGSRHGAKWARKQRVMSTTVNPALEPDNYILRNDQYVDIPNVSLPDLIWTNMDKWADKTATVCNETGRSYTFVQLRQRSITFAKALRARLRLQKGNTVAVLLPNIPEFPIALLGIIEGGLVATTINPMYKSEEISRQLIDSDAKALITLGDYHSRAVDAIREANKSIPIITIKTTQAESTPKGTIDFTEFCTREIDFNEFQSSHPDDLIVLPYSSGTTGLPKGVELTHRNIVANLTQCVDIPNLIAETTKYNQDVIPAVLPMFHIYGMTVNTLKVLQIGCQMITIPRFTPDIYINMLDKCKPQHLFLAPPIVIFLAAHPSVTKKHLDSVQSIMTGAAPLGATDAERFFHKAEKETKLVQGYGMTETSPVVCLTPAKYWKEYLGSIGSALPNTEIKIVAIDDKNATPLGPNEQGEILVRGPQVMPRYHNNPTATEEVFHDGWLRTGDMAYFDDNKILWITDRLKELIKVKGFQVAPAELEAIVRDYPDVADAAVIGIPHPIYGEVPKAFIVPKANAKINTEHIQEYVAQKVASYKRLEGGVSILAEIPKMRQGKLCEGH